MSKANLSFKHFEMLNYLLRSLW